MKFIADIHVHSRFSMATAKNLDLENLYIAAQIKGITVLGTGDITHPGWVSEIESKLVPAESGLFRLNDRLAETCDRHVPDSCRRNVRFILQGEISNIYKKDGKTRKNHNLVYFPDLDAAKAFNAKLDAIGNIRSDGRPILGLDAKTLFQILLDVCHDAFLIPAHIWTPWFSMLGSKSGFDHPRDCFDDLFDQIFAAETGLSSDPPMNRRVSDLDNLTLISNSDAHSPANIGRNANGFDTELSYFGLRNALEKGDPKQCTGTFDLYPQEGKYHYDGHRNCNVCLHPEQSMKTGGVCPVCGRSMTLGVLHRVEQLADRRQEELPDQVPPCFHIIPLAEMLSELIGTGPKTKKVQTAFNRIIQSLGPEMDILTTLPIRKIDQCGIPLLGEAIRRMRLEQVLITPGYDGQYGVIKLFDDGEKEELMGAQSLFASSFDAGDKKKKRSVENRKTDPKQKSSSTEKAAFKKALPDTATDSGVSESVSRFPGPDNPILQGLNDQQRRAVIHNEGALLIVAGPGAGKTLTLTRRIAYIIQNEKVPSDQILAVTFTNKAAEEMRDRLTALLGQDNKIPMAATFHSLCYAILRENRDRPWGIADEKERKAIFMDAVDMVSGHEKSLKPNRILETIILAKQNLVGPNDDPGNLVSREDQAAFSEIYRQYQLLLNHMQRFDFEDLIFETVKLFESNADVRKIYQHRFAHLFVDEYQDLNSGQYRIVRALSPSGKGLCVIGDPDQSIYGFRGSDVSFFTRFVEDYPESTTVRLTRSYRSTQSILKASGQVIRSHSLDQKGRRVYSDIDGHKTLTILETASEKAEAVAIGKAIEDMVGGMGIHAIDMGKTSHLQTDRDMTFSDFAVLYRTRSQSRIFADIFARAGIPFQVSGREHIFEKQEISELISVYKLVQGQGGVCDLENAASATGTAIGKKTFSVFKHWLYSQKSPLDKLLLSDEYAAVPGMPAGESEKIRQLAMYLDTIKGKSGNLPVTDSLQHIVENTSIADRIAGDHETDRAYRVLLHIAQENNTDPTRFIGKLCLQADPDVYDHKAERVTLMTMHASKGLEFPVVFIAGCEDGFIPLSMPGKNEADPEEERRLFYVAMTRAGERLFLSCAKKRMVFGQTLTRSLSPFVSDIEKALLDRKKTKGSKPKAPRHVQLGLFDSSL